ncbi:hypothetical protein NHF46_01640 [Arthrobacter alpinus]|nr:hypothetical protein [Arthrobacter alpinus]
MTDIGAREQTGNNLFRLRGERKRVFLTQLPLSLIMAVAVLIAAAIYPQSFQQPLFVAALVMHALLLLASFIVPGKGFRRPPSWSSRIWISSPWGYSAEAISNSLQLLGC